MSRGLNNARPVEFEGVTYESRAQLARAFGVTPKRLAERLKCGWSLENALKTKIRAKNGNKKVVYKGVTYPSHSALARAFDLSPRLIHERTRLGWSLEKILTTKPREIPEEKYVGMSPAVMLHMNISLSIAMRAAPGIEAWDR